MVVTKAHVDEARRFERTGADEVWKLLVEHADNEFCDEARRRIYRTESNGLPSDTEKRQLVWRFLAQSNLLWAILGTIWFAADRRLPFMTLDRLTAVVNEGTLTGAELSTFFRKFRDYDPSWHVWIDEMRERLPEFDRSQRTVYYLAKPFIDALPESIVDLSSPEHPKTSIESQIDDILKLH